MSRNLLLFPGLLLASLAGAPAVRADEARPAVQLVPQDAILVVEISQPKPLLDLALSPQVTGAVNAIPPLEKLISRPGPQQFFRLVQYLENKLGSDWRSLAGKLLGGDITFAALPRKSFLLVVDAADAAVLKDIHQVVVQLAEVDAMNKGRPSGLTSREVRGVKVWSAAGGRLAYAISGRRLLAATSEELVAGALAPAAKSAGLDALPAYREARQAVGSSTGMAWLNLALLRQAGVGKKGLEHVHPMMLLLAGGALEAARDADWAAARLRVEGTQLSVEALFNVKPQTQAQLPAYAWPAETSGGSLPNFSVAGQVAAASVYRDFHAFYRDKDKIFPERTGGLVFFENMMGIFFSGRDLADEVLVEARPEIRLVVAEQDYGTAKPAMQIPAFAVVFRVQHPEQFGDIMEAAWQKALGLANITRGQKAQPGLIIDRPIYHGTQFSMAYFPSMPGEDSKQAAVRYNFRPSLVRMGPHYVLSSSDGLARQLIDALKKEDSSPPKPLAGASTLVDVDLGAVAALVAANRAVLVRQNMLEKAASQEEAEARIDMLAGLVKTARPGHVQPGTHPGTDPGVALGEVEVIANESGDRDRGRWSRRYR